MAQHGWVQVKDNIAKWQKVHDIHMPTQGVKAEATPRFQVPDLKGILNGKG
jgi:hypothetical protein